ncbi:hypothetical protein O181_073512 [Austropuccinia psidii MF-1]|uniref:Uncharacterized protein n=1 Tax=Austropuccinia psidii MF-1 TaxID=1389203 RepID=A0A9Q3F964_9BASI|nr:hypothetical protein [Austropuccinia psidii MF-1]
MSALKIPGSIILVASLSGSITNKDHPWIAYNTSKSAVIQMARSMACELGPSAIRVNSLSPGHIRTPMTAKFLDQNPDLEAQWSSLNPLGRLGKPHELRGVIAWLASDASTFCTGSELSCCACPSNLLEFVGKKISIADQRTDWLSIINSWVFVQFHSLKPILIHNLFLRLSV